MTDDAGPGPQTKPGAKTGARRGGRDELVFLALGGLGEIGMNVYLYGYGPPRAREWLMVDLGVTFPHESEPGVEVVLPDLRFILAEGSALKGLVLTHAHEDHVGAVIDLWPSLACPIFATPFTAGMLKSKMAEFGGKRALPIKVMPLESKFEVGPFGVEFVGLSHSIPESSGVLITTPAGRVFHTGDWKLDKAPFIGKPANEARLAEIGIEGVLALVCDSTNTFREGRSPSETEVAGSLGQIIAKAPRRVVVTTFASNVARVKAAADAAHATGRRLVVAGRALHRVIGVAIETGYLPPDFEYLDQNEFANVRPEETLLLCTGSQGEARAALARIAENEHPSVSLDRGDLVIFSSRTIPGNEKAVGAVQNALARAGCDVLTDNEALVHVTGHPRRDELKQMYAWMRPEIGVPMHGEARHLKEHAKLARSCGVKTVFPILNGEILRLAPDPGVIDDAPTGRYYRDGRLIVPSDSGPVADRRKLSSVGVVLVALVLSRRGELMADPQVALDGVPEVNAEGDAIDAIVAKAVDGTLRSIPPARRKDTALVSEAVSRAVRGAVNEAWGKKPIAKVLISVLDGKG